MGKGKTVDPWRFGLQWLSSDARLWFGQHYISKKERSRFGKLDPTDEYLMSSMKIKEWRKIGRGGQEYKIELEEAVVVTEGFPNTRPYDVAFLLGHTISDSKWKTHHYLALALMSLSSILTWNLNVFLALLAAHKNEIALSEWGTTADISMSRKDWQGHQHFQIGRKHHARH